MPGLGDFASLSVDAGALPFGEHSAQVVISADAPGVLGNPQTVWVHLSWQEHVRTSHLPIILAVFEPPLEAPTVTPTLTPSLTPTPTLTHTPTSTATSTATATVTHTPTQTGTATATATATQPSSPVNTPTPTQPASPVNTPTTTPTQPASPVETPTATATAPSAQWQTIVYESFEGAFPGAWRLASNNGYTWGKTTCGYYSGSYSGWAIKGGSGSYLSCASNYPNGTRSWMIYGPFSLAQAQAAHIEFAYWLQSQQDHDYLCTLASLDGQTFYYGGCGSGYPGQWLTAMQDLSDVGELGSMLGQDRVWIAFLFRSDEGVTYPNGALVDDIWLRQCTAGDCSASPLMNSGNQQPARFTLPFATEATNVP